MPELSFLGLTVASIVFCGFLLADRLASAGEQVETVYANGGNVVALEKKLVKGL